MSEQSSNKPLVSVIIPCYNSEKFIHRAVESVLRQTYPNIELLLIDNNSTDNTYAVLKELEQEHPDKIGIFSEQAKGACAARNYGLSKAGGDWIQFLDADDELLPSKIELQVKAATTAHTDVVVDDYIKIGVKKNKTFSKKIVAADELWLGIINSSLGVTSALLWNRERLLEVNGWNAALSSSQEYDLLFRLLKRGAKFSINHQAQTLVYARTESVSRTGSADKLLQILYNRYSLRCRVLDFLSKNNLLNPKYKKHLNTYLYYHLLLISELNMPYFKAQVKASGFDDLGFHDKIKVFVRFIGHSSKRKHGYSHTILKLAEWQYFLFKNLYLLRY